MPPVYFRFKNDDSLAFSFISTNSKMILGYSEEEILENNQLFWNSIPIEERYLLNKFLLSPGADTIFVFSYTKPDTYKSQFRIELISDTFKLDGNSIEGYLYELGEDAKSKEEKSSDLDKSYTNILQNFPDLVVKVNDKNKIIFLNTIQASPDSLFSDEIIGQSINDLSLHPEIIKNIKENIEISSKQDVVRELEFHHKKSTLLYYKLRIVPEITKESKAFILIFSDITKSKLAEQTLKFAADHDSLTSLKNREYFLRVARDTIQECIKSNSKCAIVLFDVDRFQEINDSLGHMIGDELLKTVARILSEFMRPENALSRYGGDEFSAIIKSEKESGNFIDVFPILMEISEFFSKPVNVLDNQIYTSISMGIAIYPDDGDEPSLLLQNADRALYYSKQKEYNSFTFYKSDMNKQTSIKRDIVHSLRKAIEDNEFTLYYQPKIDLRSGKVSGAEALIRWNNNGNWISPMDFIPVAEESGLIIPIGKWVLEKAARDTKYIHLKGYNNFRTSVNISAKQFHVPGFGKFIIDLLSLNDLSPDMFEVEITEGVAMKNVNLSEIILRELDSRGIKISIDDFGTGHSSLAYLKKFPIDILKIDKTFIKDIPHDKESCAIVNAVLSMSHELDIEVVAEGVEENDQLEFLRNGGCEYIQGYYYSKPVPLPTLEIFLEKYNR